MKRLFALLWVLAPLSLSAAPYLISPTNDPGVFGQALFSTGIQGYHYWDYPTNAPATNVVLTGDVTKSAGSTATTIAAGHVVASMMANDLDTNVFSAGGFAHLVQLIVAQAQIQATAATNDLSANEITNKLSQQVDTNVFAALGMTHLAQVAAIQATAATNDLSANELTNKLSKQIDTNLFSASGIAHLQSLFTNLASTSVAGYAPKGDGNAAHYLDGTLNWSTPSGGGGSAFPLAADANANNFAITNLNYLEFAGGIFLTNAPGSTNAFAITDAFGFVLQVNTNGTAIFGTNGQAKIDTAGNLALSGGFTLGSITTANFGSSSTINLPNGGSIDSLDRASFSSVTTAGDVIAGGRFTGHAGGLTNLPLTVSGAALETTNASGINNVLVSNAVPVGSASVTIVTNYVAGGVTYTFTASAGSASSTNAINYANTNGVSVGTSGSFTNIGFFTSTSGLKIIPFATNVGNGTINFTFFADAPTNNDTVVSNGLFAAVQASTNGGFSLDQIARSNIVDQIQTWPTPTNQLVAVPGSTSWLLQSATPTAQTNISGTLSASQWVFQSLLVSNITAAAFTNWVTIPGAKAVGYAATNDVASLGIPGTVIPASSYKELLFKFRLGQTNWAVINQ